MIDGVESLGEWRVVRALDKGAQARTFLVVRGGGQVGVAKVLLPLEEVRKGTSPEGQIRRFLTEINTLRSLGTEGCPRIVEVLDSNVSGTGIAEDETPYYVMPYYEAGPLRTVKGAFIEGVAGNVDRILEIGSLLAETLTFMHERPVQVVHRDVHTGNIFFATPSGSPVLGDFGLAYEQERAVGEGKVGTRGNEEFGPYRWRPPELTQASIDKRNSKSDVYMLGGVVYECLSSGEYIDDVEPAPGQFGHETPPKNLMGALGDPRVTLVNALLRHVLVRNPDLRITARQLGDGLLTIRTYEPGQAVPALPQPPELVLAEARLQQTVRVKTERARWEQRERVIRLAQGIRFREEKARWQVSRIIDAAVSEPQCAQQYPDFVFGAAVRVLIGVDLQSGQIPSIHSYLWLGRSETEEVVIAERYAQGDSEELLRSFPDDPRLSEVIAHEARREIERLSPIYATILARHG